MWHESFQKREADCVPGAETIYPRYHGVENCFVTRALPSDSNLFKKPVLIKIIIWGRIGSRSPVHDREEKPTEEPQGWIGESGSSQTVWHLPVRVERMRYQVPDFSTALSLV